MEEVVSRCYLVESILGETDKLTVFSLCPKYSVDSQVLR